MTSASGNSEAAARAPSRLRCGSSSISDVSGPDGANGDTLLHRRFWLIATVLGTALAGLPFLRCVMWPGDEGIWIRGATEMLGGAAPYRDFFEFHPPGIFLITVGWLHAFGVSILAIRALAILTIVGIATLAYLCCVVVSQSAPISAGLALIWVVLTQGVETIVSHNYFTTLISLAAMLAALGRRDGLCGALGGLATMVTPHRGLFVTAATAWTFLRRRRSGIFFVAAWFIAPLFCLAYIVAIGAANQAWRDVVVFTATRYAAVQSVPFGSGTTPLNFLLTVAFPLAFVFAALLLFDGEVRRSDAYKLSVGLAVAGLLGCMMRPHVANIRLTVPLALPLLSLGISMLSKRMSAPVRLGALCIAAAAVAPGVLAYAYVVQVISGRPVISTPAGGVQFMLPEVAEVAQAATALPAQDRVFFYPNIPLLPVLTGKKQVGKVDVFVPKYTTTTQYDTACRDIQEAKWIIRDRVLSNPDLLRRTFPGIADPHPPEVARFERCMDAQFFIKAQFGRFDLLARRGA